MFAIRRCGNGANPHFRLRSYLALFSTGWMPIRNSRLLPGSHWRLCLRAGYALELANCPSIRTLSHHKSSHDSNLFPPMLYSCSTCAHSATYSARHTLNQPELSASAARVSWIFGDDGSDICVLTWPLLFRRQQH